ncbi:uncharacterized protein LOC142329130 [Lycorma delicatula]|uniref:uncharacterized protein LOC142329130 n=1 Tax=Lycorma delicatula TaxID=130591 RepID=UPI003F513D6E
MDELNDSADIFANSSTETVAENIDYSLFLNENNKKVNEFENFQLVLKPEKNELTRLYRPFCTSSPLAESSTAFKTNISKNASMNISFLTNQFISEAFNIPVTLYCPFCPDEFKLEFLLKDHIKVTHPNELKNIIRRDLDSENGEFIEFNSCPFCHATFYNKDLLPKHVVRKHQECVMSMFTDVNPDRYVHCPFCNHKVLVRHSKLLINHIEKKHSTEFQLAISSRCSNILLNSDELSFFDYRARKGASECSSLSKKMQGLTTSSGDIKSKPIKSILKKTTSYNEGLNLNDSNNYGDKELSTFSLNNSSFIERRTVRRRLRFELPPPDSPEDDNNKENSIFNTIKRRNFTSSKDKTKSRWRNLFRKNKNNDKKKDNKNKKSNAKITTKSPDKFRMSPKLTGNYNKKEVQTTPVYSCIGFKGEGMSQLTIKQFKCGLCFEGFNKNALLLEHLRRSHRGLKLVPQYRCGECDAKFFRNSFLVRHCWFHHTPKCLKTGSTEELK